MRKFNKKEKEIISELVHIQDRYEGNMMKFVREYIFPRRTGEALYFDYTNQNAYFLYPICRLHSNDDSARVDRFYEFLSLLIYLEESRFITVFNIPNYSGGWDDITVLGECFDETGRESEYGYRTDCPKEGENFFGPLGYRGDEITHNSFELGKKIYCRLLQFIDNHVYISEDLRQLEKHKYKTKEEWYSFWQLRATGFAIIVAIAIGIIGVTCR